MSSMKRRAYSPFGTDASVVMAKMNCGQAAEVLMLKVDDRLPVRDWEALSFPMVPVQLEPGIGARGAAQLLPGVDDEAIEDARFVEGVGEGEVVDSVEGEEMAHQLLRLLARPKERVRLVEFVHEALEKRSIATDY